MEYSSPMRRRPSPGRAAYRANSGAGDDPNVFDFPVARKGRSSNRTSKKKQQPPRGGGRPADDGHDDRLHPYPTSISIRMDGDGESGGRRASPSEKRSPSSSPKGSPSSGGRRGERRQSPAAGERSQSDGAAAYATESSRHHETGRRAFLTNNLSDAVESYSAGVKSGLDELAHRRNMLERIGSSDKGKDRTTTELGSSLAALHSDLGTALEVAEKYPEAKSEWEKALGMLTKTCGASRNDPRVKSISKNVAGVERAIGAARERRRLENDVDEAKGRLETAGGLGSRREVESARKHLVTSTKRLAKHIKETLGANSYAHAKIQLKLAKARLQSLPDPSEPQTDEKSARKVDKLLAEIFDEGRSAVDVLQLTLGKEHTLVATGCVFAAGVARQRVASLLSDQGSSGPEIGTAPLSAEAKGLVNAALELYATALPPLRYKYANTIPTEDGSTAVQPDVAETHCRIAELYELKGSLRLAEESYVDSLGAFGVDVDRDAADKGREGRGFDDVHPSAALAWHGLASLHLKMGEFERALHEGERCLHLVRVVLMRTENDEVNGLRVTARECVGDAHLGLGRHDAAAEMFKEGLREFKSGRCDSGPLVEARLLRKLGRSSLKSGRTDEARNHLEESLRILQSDKHSARAGLELPRALSDVAEVHLRRGDASSAVKTLRGAITRYVDLGCTERDSDMARARSLFKEAQLGPPTASLLTGKSSASPLSAGNITHETPRGSPSTCSTAPSTAHSSLGGYSRGESRGSRMSGHGQLQTLFEELQSPEASRASVATTTVASIGQSTKVGSPSDGGNESFLQQRLSKAAASEMDELRRRLQVAEAERDRERREMILAATEHRREVEEITKGAAESSTLLSNVESLKRDVAVSESSYQQLVKAVDDEKDRLAKLHDEEKRGLRDELARLKDELSGSGAVEVCRMKDALKGKSDEVESARRRNQQLEEENMALKSANRTILAEKEAALLEVSTLKMQMGQTQSEAQALSSKLAEAHRALNSASNANVDELKRLEFELQSERSRRMILETSLQEECDKEASGGVQPQQQPPQQQYTFMPGMPWGMPMMAPQAAPQLAPAGGNSMKIKTLEIDLATERASKEMLEGVIRDLRKTHDGENAHAEEQLSAMAQSRDQEISHLVLQLESKQREADALLSELDGAKSANAALESKLHGAHRELEDMLNELRDVKSQMGRMSNDLSSAAEERERTTGRLAALDEAQRSLHAARAELQVEREASAARQSELDSLMNEHARLSKDHGEAIDMFEREVEAAKAERDEARSLWCDDVSRLKEDLDSGRTHLTNVMSELEGAHRAVESLETDVRHLNVGLDAARKEVLTKEEQLKKSSLEKRDLADKVEELRERATLLDESLLAEREVKAGVERNLESAREELARVEKTVVELEKTIQELKSSGSDSNDRLLELQEIKAKSEALLGSISERLDDILDGSAAASEQPRDERESRSVDATASKINRLLKQIRAQNHARAAEMRSRDDELQRAQHELSTVTNDLDILEGKHKRMRENLAENTIRQDEYDKLLEQYDLVAEERDTLTESLEAISIERENLLDRVKEIEVLEKSKEERDLYESQLKEACDDLEGLELERDELKVELNSLQVMYAEKESTEASLNARVTALKTDNEQVDILESQVMELQAAMYARDGKIEALTEELNDAKNENRLKNLETQALEHFADVNERDEKIIALEELVDTARDEVDRMRQNTNVERVTELESQILCFDAEINAKESRIESLEEELDIAKSNIQTLERNLARREVDTLSRMHAIVGETNYPDILSTELSATGYGSSRACDDSATNPFADEPSVDDSKRQARHLNQSDRDEIAMYRADQSIVNVSEIRFNRDRSDDNTVDLDCRQDKLLEEIEELKNKLDTLDESNSMLKEELAAASALRETECETIEILRATLNDNERLHATEINQLRHELSMAEERSRELAETIDEFNQPSNIPSEDEAIERQSEQGTHLYSELVDQVSTLNARVKDLDETNRQLQSQVSKAKSDFDDASEMNEKYQEAITTLQGELTKTLNEQDSLHQSELEALSSSIDIAAQARESDQETIENLKKSIEQQDALFQDKMAAALRSKDSHHRTEVNKRDSDVRELQRSNVELQRQLGELSSTQVQQHKRLASTLQMELQNALNQREENKVKHGMELAVIKQELQSANASLEDLRKENGTLKSEIETLLARTSTNQSRNFEKEMNAAHSRFESMEKALQKRVTFLEQEKEKLLSEFNDELALKEEVYTQTRIELSAWKLEMQNALNDIESLKKERDDLKAQVEGYVVSLEAVVSAKAEIEEEMHRMKKY